MDALPLPELAARAERLIGRLAEAKVLAGAST
jgi:hypothetical protein